MLILIPPLHPILTIPRLNVNQPHLSQGNASRNPLSILCCSLICAHWHTTTKQSASIHAGRQRCNLG